MEVNGVTVVIFGFGTVFVGLISLIFVISLMSAIYNKVAKKAAPAAAPAAKAAPAPAADDKIENRGQFVAAVSAALATVMGKDVSGLRIVSIKKVK